MAPPESDKPQIPPSIEEVKKAIQDLGDSGLDRLNRSLLFRIDHMAQRIEYAESRRTSIATFSIGLVAASVALFAILVDAPRNPLSVALSVLGVSVLIVAVLTLTAWLRQTNPPYGFIQAPKEQRPWKWFYRDALDDHEAFTFDWFRSKSDKKNGEDPIAAFEAQWAPFFRREIGLADPEEDVLQNLQQVYVLHVNERYKNLFLSQLRNVLLKGLIISLVVFLLALGIGLLVTADSSSPAVSTPTALTSTSASS